SYRAGSVDPAPDRVGSGQSRPSRSAFLASYSSALMAPRSRRSARLASVRVTSSADIWVGAGAAAGAGGGGGGADGAPVPAAVSTGVIDAADGARIAGPG